MEKSVRGHKLGKIVLATIFAFSGLGVSSVFASQTAYASEATNFRQIEGILKAAEVAGNKLKWEISMEYRKKTYKNPVTVPDMKLYNEVKGLIQKAEASISALPGGSQKSAFQKRLEDNVKIHYTRAQAYIDAITSGKKIITMSNKFNELYSIDPIDEETIAQYHAISAEIRKQAVLLYRVYGKSTREEILNVYKAPGEKIVNENKALIQSIDILMDWESHLTGDGLSKAKFTEYQNLIKGLLPKLSSEEATKRIGDLFWELQLKSIEEPFGEFKLLESASDDTFNGYVISIPTGEEGSLTIKAKRGDNLSEQRWNAIKGNLLQGVYVKREDTQGLTYTQSFSDSYGVVGKTYYLANPLPSNWSLLFIKVSDSVDTTTDDIRFEVVFN